MYMSVLVTYERVWNHKVLSVYVNSVMNECEIIMSS